jgi:hypothetical protein
MISFIRPPPRLAGGTLFSQVSTALVYGVTAVSIAAIGVLGLLERPGKLPPSHGWIGIHGLFGVALSLGVIVLFAWYASHHAFTSARSIADFARRLSRRVYLLLYALAGIKETAFLIATPHLSLADAMKVLQYYVICGVFALLTIRLLAALCHFYVIPRNPTPLRRL